MENDQNHIVEMRFRSSSWICYDWPYSQPVNRICIDNSIGSGVFGWVRKSAWQFDHCQSFVHLVWAKTVHSSGLMFKHKKQKLGLRPHTTGGSLIRGGHERSQWRLLSTRALEASSGRASVINTITADFPGESGCHLTFASRVREMQEKLVSDAGWP